MQQFDCEKARNRCLLGRLRDRGIARCERRGNLADKDRDRKIPRRYAGKNPAPPERERVFLARRAFEENGIGEQPPRLGRVIAQKIDRLAHL